MSAVDHDGSLPPAPFGQGFEYSFKNARFTPTDETVVERFMGAVDFGGVAPPAAVADNVDNAADNFAVVNPGHAPDLVGQQGLEGRELGVREPKVLIFHDHSSSGICFNALILACVAQKVRCVL